MNKFLSREEFIKWRDAGKHLPRLMRDFHDQKHIFKRIQWLVNQSKKQEPDDIYLNYLPEFNINMIYTIDFFLWFMAARGYTLQKSRKKFNFIKIEDSLKELEDAEDKILKRILKPKVQTNPLDFPHTKKDLFED